MNEAEKNKRGEPRPSQPKRREDLRINATPEALTKAMFGGAPKRAETRRSTKPS